MFQFGHALRCPAAKFITHTFSHLCFLMLLAAATFRLDEGAYPIASSADSQCNNSTFAYPAFNDDKMMPEDKIKQTFRPANTLMTNVQMCLWFWILGECIVVRVQ